MQIDQSDIVHFRDPRGFVMLTNSVPTKDQAAVYLLNILSTSLGTPPLVYLLNILSNVHKMPVPTLT